MCVLKNALAFISSVLGLSFAQKYWATCYSLVPFTLLAFVLSLLIQKTLKSYLSVLAAIPLPKSLINTFCSSLGLTLFLIENATIDPLQLRVIKYYFLAPLPGSVALLVSEVGKEALYFCFYFVVATFCPYG